MEENRTEWIGDSETFAYDNFWVFYNTETQEIIRIHNDNLAVKRFIAEENPIITGFNLRDYDQHILKANLLDYAPEDIKEVNDVIIDSHNDALAVYNHFQGEPWVELPPFIDIFHDIVGRPSLKQLEGFMGASVEECTAVPFDIDRPLTKDEIDSVFDYCQSDVLATNELRTMREEYVQSKVRMCEICDVDPLRELKHPMPRLAADLLGATKQEYDNEPYVCPPNIKLDNIPRPILDLISDLDRDKGLRTKKSHGDDACATLFEFYGCVGYFGVGGLHAVPGHIGYDSKGRPIEVKTPYTEQSNDERVLLIQDGSAYYPNTIVRYGYMSRSVPETHSHIYPMFIKVKDEAKAAGDKATETAAKLFINAISGTMRSPTNKLSDPMMGISLCVTGQLSIMDLISRICEATDDTRLIQVNTDGYIISVKRTELDKINAIVAEWEDETKISIGTDVIDRLWQRDVNNYIAVFDTGLIKTVGGTVGGYYGREKNWAKRGFAYSNTIIDKAIVDKLVYGIDMRETIDNETDLSRFQIITKAGHGYTAVYKDCYNVFEVIPEGSRRKVPRILETVRGEKVNKVNRIYATKDTTCGKLMKETPEGKLQSFSDTPPHAFVDNKNTEMTLDMLDREWYNDLAEKKLNDFIGEEMTEEKLVEPAPESAAAPKKATATRKPAAKALTFFEKYRVFQGLIREALADIEPNDFIEHINYEYVNTGIYKDVVAACAQEADLIYSANYSELVFLNTLEKTRSGANNYGCTVKVALAFDDALVNDQKSHGALVEAYGFGIGSGGNCVSSAQTNAMRNAIINGLLVKTNFDDDVAQANKENDEKKKPTGYLNNQQKEAIKDKVKEETKASVQYVQGPAANDLYERLAEALSDKADELGEKTTAAFNKVMADHFSADGKPNEVDGHLTLTKALYTAYATKLDGLGV